MFGLFGKKAPPPAKPGVPPAKGVMPGATADGKQPIGRRSTRSRWSGSSSAIPDFFREQPKKRRIRTANRHGLFARFQGFCV